MQERVGYKRKRNLSMLTAVCMLFFAVFATAASAGASSSDTTPLTNLISGWPQMTAINEASGVVMDADSGGIMYSLNRDTIRYPASTTKILTALIAIENASLGETVTMTETGVAFATNGSTNAATSVGEEFTVEQCLYIMLLKSANDIATQLAEHVGGTVDDFVALMNERAEAIGCTNTHFTNPSGMPDTEHYSTAADMALIMQECLKNDLFRKIIATESYTVPPTNKTSSERVYENHCKLILPDSEFYYSPCIGGKTGFTQAAWRTLVTAAERDGRTLICVLMRGPDNTDFSDTRRLYEYAFYNFSVVELDGVPCSLPSGFDTSTLTKETTEREDGSVAVTWKYSKLPVGSKVFSAEEYGAETGTVNDSGPGEVVQTAEVDAIPVRNGLSTGTMVLALAILLLILAGAVYAYYRGSRKRHRRRRR